MRGGGGEAGGGEGGRGGKVEGGGAKGGLVGVLLFLLPWAWLAPYSL